LEKAQLEGVVIEEVMEEDSEGMKWLHLLRHDDRNALRL